jgi:hypothetical protein
MNIAKINKEGFSFFSLSASLFIHILILLTAGILMRFFSEYSSADSAYIMVETAEIENIKNIPENIVDEKIFPIEEKIEKQKAKLYNEISFPDINKLSADTSVLMQLYKEPSLNVCIKYPSGWKYIDQNRKNKLDGVTFWASAVNYNPPPYIHLEVKEKYLFNPERFKYRIKINDNTAYFNDPEEMSGQFSQVIYLRTDSNEDYSLKLIMEGKESFYSFQPMFFAMLKTFKFGKNFF